MSSIYRFNFLNGHFQLIVRQLPQTLSHVYRIVIHMSRTISAEGGAAAATKSAEGGAATYCRRSVHHHPRPIGRVEIYRETRTLSIRQIVAGKFRPKKKRRGQENNKSPNLFQSYGNSNL